MVKPNSFDSQFLLKELKKQQKKMEFEIAVKCMSILRYLTDCVERYETVLKIQYLFVNLIMITSQGFVKSWF